MQQGIAPRARRLVTDFPRATAHWRSAYGTPHEEAADLVGGQLVSRVEQIDAGHWLIELVDEPGTSYVVRSRLDPTEAVEAGDEREAA